MGAAALIQASQLFKIRRVRRDNLKLIRTICTLQYIMVSVAWEPASYLQLGCALSHPATKDSKFSLVMPSCPRPQNFHRKFAGGTSSGVDQTSFRLQWWDRELLLELGTSVGNLHSNLFRYDPQFRRIGGLCQCCLKKMWGMRATVVFPKLKADDWDQPLKMSSSDGDQASNSSGDTTKSSWNVILLFHSIWSHSH